LVVLLTDWKLSVQQVRTLRDIPWDPIRSTGPVNPRQYNGHVSAIELGIEVERWKQIPTEMKTDGSRAIRDAARQPVNA